MSSLRQTTCLTMLTELLQDRAARYLTGAMLPDERENLELVLKFHEDLRDHMSELSEVTAAVAMTGVRQWPALRPEMKERLLGSLRSRPRLAFDALVVTDGQGRIEWMNDAFTGMCGYTLGELRGRKPGHVLQGPRTDAAAVGRIRDAVQEGRPCRETLVNYHKDGSTYTVDLRITPVLDDAGQPLWFVAEEQKLIETVSVA